MDTAILFLANLINERETRKAGYSMPVRWLCLREDLQQEYLSEASKMVYDWWMDEQAAKLSRDTRNPYNPLEK